jgi:hypothetical protein
MLPDAELHGIFGELDAFEINIPHLPISFQIVEKL